jgi:threonine/homoserine/homoserine lactone efflux protein
LSVNDAVVFALTCLLLLAAPGPTNALLASAGATGTRRALSLLAAEAGGYLIAVGSLTLLAGSILTVAPVLVIALKSAAAAWLFWTGLSFWRTGMKHFTQPGLVQPRTVFITTLLNPKSLVIAFGLMPPATAGTGTLIAHLAILLSLATLTGCIWIVGGTALARAGAAPYAAKATAVVLSAFGFLLLGSVVR